MWRLSAKPAREIGQLLPPDDPELAGLTCSLTNGEIEMTNFKQIGDGLFIGPQPTGQDLLEAKQRGIQTVIDMRMPGETATSNADLVRNNGLNYVNVPVNKAALSEQQIDELGQVMQRTQGPHLLHCATGTRAALL